MVDQNSASWNPIGSWLRQLDLLRSADCVNQESTSLGTIEQDKIAERLLRTEHE